MIKRIDIMISGSTDEAPLKAALSTMCKTAHSDITSGVRAIIRGDELSLTPKEQVQTRTSTVSVRAASGAARIVARDLLRAAGAPLPWDLNKLSSGALEWPDGFIGSLSHDPEVAIAVIASNRRLQSIGIDVEPITPLPTELIKLVATKNEINDLDGSALNFKLLFCVKEAVYKATNVLNSEYLDYHDVEYSFKSKIAKVRKGGHVKVHTLTWPRFVALAIIEY